MKHKVAELEGSLLDAAVAKAHGLVLASAYQDRYGLDGVWVEMPGILAKGTRFAPSDDWSIGGPIIERERIGTVWLDSHQVWHAVMARGKPDWSKPLFDAEGPTPLVAAMRAFVIFKLGHWVELP